MSVEFLNLQIRLSPVPLERNTNRIIGLICPFLPPRVFVKCPSISKMVGRGGGDRNDKYFNKASALNALQPTTPANWNKRNRMPGLLAPTIELL
jgi:hypothetical protein